MAKRRILKIGIIVVAVVAVAGLSLAVLTDTSAAQGPGGRGGRGNGQRVGQQPGGAYGDSIGLGMQNSAGWQNSNQQQMQYWLLDLPPAVPGDLPADVVAALSAGIQDEYHAYATYQAVIDQFGAVRPFTNIQMAESSHIAALSFIIERYGLTVPEPEPLVDVPQFDTLADACAAGAAAEIANFELYDQWLATVQEYPDIVQVFQMLRDASEFQHLPAFENCAGWIAG